MDYSINLVGENFDSAKDFNCYDKLVTIYNEASSQLNTWESYFVDNLLTGVPRSFSDKQKIKIGQIFKRYCMD